MMEWLIAAWPFVLTVLLPFVVALIARMEWSSNAKSWLATGLALVVGVAAVLTTDIAITPENLALVVAVVRGGVQIVYDLFRNVGITSKWLDALLQLGSG